MIEVVLASQLTLLREGMKHVLGAHDDIRVIAEIGHVPDVPGDDRIRPDVLYVVAHPSAGDVGDYLHRVSRLASSARVILITRSPSLHQVLAILRTGVRGLLNANCGASQLPAAIKAVAAGRLYLHEEVARLVAAGLGEVGKDHSHRSLSQRELDIFIRLASGQKVSEIASQLRISSKTVSTHKARMMEKMGMRSYSQLIQYAVANSLYDASLAR